MNVSFQIDKRSKKSLKPLIGYASFYPQKPVKFSTNIKLKLENWSQKEHEIIGKEDHIIDLKDEFYSLRRFIDVELYKKYLGRITRDEFKREISLFLNKGEKKNSNEYNLCFYIQKYLDMNPHLEYVTSQQYLKTKDLLAEFKDYSNLTDDVVRLKDKEYSLSFFSDFMGYLLNVKEYLNPTVENRFVKIGRVISYFDLEINNHRGKLFNAFSKKVNYEQTKSIIVTREEVQALYDYKPKNQNEFAAKMSYLFAYETGLEVSALFLVKKSNIREVISLDNNGNTIRFNVMDVVTKKHRDSNMRTVYIGENAMRILDEANGPYLLYDYDSKTKSKIYYEDCAIPVRPRNINIYLKRLFKGVSDNMKQKAIQLGYKDYKSSLEEDITYIKYRGGEKVVTTKPKWQRVTMHTARHSFINNVESLGLNITEAGKLAGHASHKTTEKHYQRKNIEVPLAKLHAAKQA